jgi:hypothetical protein
LLLTIVGWALLAFLLRIVYHLEEYRGQWASAFGIYLAIAALITPAPDSSNLGWAGGLIDNPFRISDDFNRMLGVLLVVLIPGKIIIFAVATVVRLARNTLFS